MPEQNDGRSRKLLADMLVRDMYVINNKIPAVFVGEVPRITVMSAMPAMVVCTDHESARICGYCKPLVAGDVFAETMQQLDYAGDFSVRMPNS